MDVVDRLEFVDGGNVARGDGNALGRNDVTTEFDFSRGEGAFGDFDEEFFFFESAEDFAKVLHVFFPGVRVDEWIIHVGDEIFVVEVTEDAIDKGHEGGRRDGEAEGWNLVFEVVLC